ncbi:NADP-dependent oxidoreductase [Lactiplantibacillus plantarum]|uniref:NADP-dependent oxidoreductase n=1 Tax=Lactiplantibacillus plantarum TaxID=1590 RepID=UPI000FECDD1F|nr:NADP-dependent oxidoreductase [Lactiplantibacillus plantarum]MBW1622347.1 NADP-dependent oxidoreductase [Lactiplantibacillus plantarum]QAR39129.1 NADP-dependent oxidoreductase [Lactiplantibacillus plantarum]RWZ09302.1 NADP-dependent oxidoreductase [Lactiplantibacillus plantarum]RWZ37145.1 NADP-dependent oxidoreductase [Lactiplantibacillus plantarum]WNW15784.1 NADP-dependent oxidoreductase [Lactiplantibacillus plantarum]
MKAFGFNQYGNSNVMEELNIPIPKIKPGEVLVKTTAFAINAFDIAVRNGQFRNNVTLLFPTILGTDGVGRIVKLGAGVHDYSIGDDVLARPGIGTYAEYFKVSVDHLGSRPSNYSPYEAAGLPLSGITAYNTLVHIAHVKQGQTVVILGSSGGVGSMLVQMAHALGLYVIGTDAESARETVLNLGASEFGAYDTERVSSKFKSMADILIDATNLGASIAGIQIVKPTGTYVSLTTLPKDRTLKPDVIYRQVIPRREYRDSDAFTTISLMIRNNQLHVPIDHLESFTLDGIRKGQSGVENGNPDGKVIVTL